MSSIQYFAGIQCHSRLAMGRGSREAGWLPWVTDPIALVGPVGDWFVLWHWHQTHTRRTASPGMQIAPPLTAFRVNLQLLVLFPSDRGSAGKPSSTQWASKEDGDDESRGRHMLTGCSWWMFDRAILSQNGGECPTVCVLVGYCGFICQVVKLEEQLNSSEEVGETAWRCLLSFCIMSSQFWAVCSETAMQEARFATHVAQVFSTVMPKGKGRA